MATQCTKAIASTSTRQEDGVALLRVTLQVLTNASTSHQHNQQLVWERLFPDGFSDLLRANDDSSISHTCILIFNSCALSSSRRTELAHANKLLTVLLEQLENNSLSSLSSSSSSSVNSPAKERIIEWLLRLFTLLVEDGHFVTMHNTLGAVGQHPFSKERAVLLKVLDGMLCKMLNPLAEEDSEEKEEREQVSDENSTASERLENVQLASFLAPSVIQTLAIDLQDIFLCFTQQPNNEEREEAEEAEEEKLKRAKLLGELKDGSLQTASLPVAYCWLLLQGLASITALVFSHSYRHSPSFPSARALKDAFSSSNVLSTVLEFLEWAVKYLGAAYYRFDKANEEKQHLSFALKRDLVRVLCNMCFRDKHNQDLVRENGGLPLILNLCRIDEKNPYIREWCLLAIRNLCEENAANQAFIAGLDLKGAASNKELAEMGLKVEVANEDTEGPPTRFPSSYQRPTTTAPRVTLRKADAEQQQKGEEEEEDKDQNE
ncbi:Ataxin-10, variant 2 [Balamuthia mandrillaris]